MVMNTMQFGDYIFKYNPEKIEVLQGESLVEHFFPGKGMAVQNMGRKTRKIKCYGVFTGKKLADTLSQIDIFTKRHTTGTAKMLFVPGIEPFYAVVKEFAVDMQGDGRLIPYTILFVEENSFGGGGI